jgi:hypothetical protein
MNEQTPFEKRAREVLDESAGRLDGRTQSRLTQARHAALARHEKPVRDRWRQSLPAGAAAAAAVAAVLIWTASGVNTESQPVQGGNGSAFEDIDLLADGDAPDFVNETDDVEFYEWAAGEIET